MKVYVIVDIYGYEFCSDDQDHGESVRNSAYASIEKAHEAICKEIINGGLTNGYGESIIVDKLPTIEELEESWIIEQGPEYNGYRIQEVEVIE